jgi:hypothetical protein
VVRPAEEEAAGFVVDEGVGDGLDNATAVKGAKAQTESDREGASFYGALCNAKLKCCNIEASRACKGGIHNALFESLGEDCEDGLDECMVI